MIAPPPPRERLGGGLPAGPWVLAFVLLGTVPFLGPVNLPGR